MTRVSGKRVLAVAVGMVAVIGATAALGAKAQTSAEPQELTVLTNPISIYGLTPKSLKSKNTIASWYRHYGALWRKRFPTMKINEIQTTGDQENVTKTILGVNRGDPPDLVGVHGQLPLLVARRAVENLDKYYEAAGIEPGDLLKPVADSLRFNGHWYGLPGGTNPTYGTLLSIPKFVRAAGIKNDPVTWSALYAASKKAVKFDDKGNLVRVGLQVDLDNSTLNLYCGKPTTYDVATNTFSANAPCIKAGFAYRKKLLDLYGGVEKYTKFVSGDPSVWTCSKKAYLPSGKILFMTDAYWSGGQMDTCYDVVWKIGPIPTHAGSLSDWRGLSPGAWVLAIPRGAKNAQLAFDFVKFTIFDHGDRLGPTTNGYSRQALAAGWAKGLVAYSATVRKKNSYPGNPMAAAMKPVMLGAKLGRVPLPTSPVATYYDEQMSLAWQKVAYGKATIDDALNEAQELIDRQMKLQPKTIG